MRHPLIAILTIVTILNLVIVVVEGLDKNYKGCTTCDTKMDFVCGDNGMKYLNPCEMRLDACRTKSKIKIKKKTTLSKGCS